MVETLGFVTVMRKLLFVVLVSVLVLSPYLVRSEGIPNVEAFADIYQGDLILNDNNVTIIEGYFAINGSIFVEDNATLILRNAVTNFTKTSSGIGLRYPTNGNPRLQAENTEIAGYTSNHLYGNSSVTFSNVTGNAFFQFYDETSGVFLGSTFDGFQARGFSTVTVFNSTLQYVEPVLAHGNASVVNLSPGFFNYWDFQENCSVAFKLLPQTQAPDIVINQTTVNTWGLFFQGNSSATITKCELIFLQMTANTTTYPTAKVDAYDSIVNGVELYTSATVTLTNTTYVQLRLYDSTEVYVYWYLDVHVIDSVGQHVPSASVTVAFPNATVAQAMSTGAHGWASFTLMEKMTNATASYPVGNYDINATYLSHSDGAAVNMTENHAITLVLSDFVIPEFPSFLVLPLFMIATLASFVAYKRRPGRMRQLK